ncbi:type III-A CRISPR-associated protein Cas10/Csm1, partial [Thermus scotoductus]
MPEGIALALAGLLHDIGKLFQRARWGEREGRARHPAFSARFVEQHGGLFRQAGLDPGWLQRTVQRHHEGWREAPEFQPQTPEEWCVALADTYASQEREEAAQAGSGSVPDTPLLSVFHQLWLQEREGERLALSPVHRLGEGLRPGAPYPEGRPNIGKDVYRRLEERVGKRMGELASHAPTSPEALLLSLAAILQESLTLVPADTQSEPDVSLYDHLRLTAAIAHALWLYHGGQASVEELRQDAEKFLLVVGDLGGIQGHIYRVAGAETG